MADRVDLKTMGRADLESFVETLDEPSYRGRQLYNWIYAHGATDFAEMTSLSKSLRSRLSDVARVSSITVKRMQQSDDGTSKALFTLPSGREAETVLIASFDALGNAQRLTVCVSSQVGCAMGCSFCATGLMGFQENLTPGAIYDQVWVMNQEAQERYGRSVSNVVFMGMGEPLLNYDAVLQSVALLTDEDTLNMSPRRITISTVGLARRIRDLADDDPRTNLAVSLHAPTDEQRSAIMPVNQSEKTSLDALEAAIRYYADTTGRPITYEYCLFEGVNDAVTDAKNLAEITRWAPSKVNILMYNPVPSLPFERTTNEQLNRFVQALVEEGVTVTVRQSRGQDIDAACGQLANA